MHHRCRPIGGIIVFVGIFIILSMILPSTFWWFILGAALIVFGIYMLRL